MSIANLKVAVHALLKRTTPNYGAVSPAQVDHLMVALFGSAPVFKDFSAGDVVLPSGATAITSSVVVTGQVEAWRDEAYLGTLKFGNLLAPYAAYAQDSPSMELLARSDCRICEFGAATLQAALESSDPAGDRTRLALVRVLDGAARDFGAWSVHALDRLLGADYGQLSSGARIPAYGGGRRSSRLERPPSEEMRVVALPVDVEVFDPGSVERMPPETEDNPRQNYRSGWIVFARSTKALGSGRGVCALTVEVSRPGGPRQLPIGLWCDRVVDLAAAREHLGLGVLFGAVRLEGRAPMSASSMPRRALLRTDQHHALALEYAAVSSAGPATQNIVPLLSWMRRFAPGTWADRAGVGYRAEDFVCDRLIEVPLRLANVQRAQAVRVTSTRPTQIEIDGTNIRIRPKAAPGLAFLGDVGFGPGSLVRDYLASPPADMQRLAWKVAPTTPSTYQSSEIAPNPTPLDVPPTASASGLLELALRHLGMSASARSTLVPILSAGATRSAGVSGEVFRSFGDLGAVWLLVGGELLEWVGDAQTGRWVAGDILVPRFALAPAAFFTPPARGGPVTFISSATLGLITPFTVRHRQGQYRTIDALDADILKVRKSAVQQAAAANGAFRAAVARHQARRARRIVSAVGDTHLETTQQVFAGPTGRFIPGPYSSRNTRLIAVPVTLNPAQVQPLLPPRTEIIGQVGIALFSALSGFTQPLIDPSRKITYREDALAVVVRCGRFSRPRLAFPWIAPNNLMAQTVGREVYGYPKVVMGVYDDGRRPRVRSGREPVLSADAVAPGPRASSLGVRLLRQITWPLALAGAPFRLLSDRAAGRRQNTVPGLPLPVLGWRRVLDPGASAPGSTYDPARFIQDALVAHLIEIAGLRFRRLVRFTTSDLELPDAGGHLDLTPFSLGIELRCTLSLLPARGEPIVDYMSLSDQSSLEP